MRTFFLLALLALAAIGGATAQYEDLRGEGAHETQCQERQAMDACRDYLMKQCTASTMPITWPWKWLMASCRELKHRCCNQLEQVPPTCRCKAIRSTVQEIHGSKQKGMMISEVRQMAKTLPSICNMYPTYCNIPMATTSEECYC
uniref:Putative storage protein n=1 Tax=Eragrostis tef TaxID=110835 RepID=A0A173G7R5_ERATE|nr:putative storage protein [Eragrostis tef]